MSDLVQRAEDYARDAHGANPQHRRGDGAPYIVHPEAVAQLVASVTDDVATIAAAWLHDVVEDTPATLEDIRSEFGVDVASLVAAVTDVSTPADGNRRARKAKDRAHVAAAEPRAKTIKLADVIDNLSSIDELDPGFAAKYVEEKALVIEVLVGGDSTLHARAQECLRQARDVIAGGSDTA